MIMSSETANKFMDSVYRFVEVFTGKSLNLPFKEIGFHAEVDGILKGLADNFEVMAAVVKEASVQGFDLEKLKALEPGKIYAIEVDLNAPGAAEWCERLSEAVNLMDIQFLIFLKDTMKLISVPEGLEVTQK